jgi:sulfite reductase beta subunit-like hemoprotein
MSAQDESRTLGRTRLSFASAADLDEFADILGKFERGEVASDVWRAFRLVRGAYGQRQEGDLSMLRTKLPQGLVEAAQLRALASVGEKYSRGFGHITTRQNVQFHFMKLHDVEAAMRELAETGITTREACGNSVRNITCCPYAGVAHDELFDVTPYSESLTRFLLRHPFTSSLPRKFKIAFEGCASDHAFTAINDLGFRARVEKGVRGFRITVAGGTAIMCRSGNVLQEFVPAGEIYWIAEAVIRVFHRLGDRKNRQKNRLKFLVQKLGWEGFLAEYRVELENARAAGRQPVMEPGAVPPENPPGWPRRAPPTEGELAAKVTAQKPIGPGLPPVVTPQLGTHAESFAQWRKHNVAPQRQEGFVLITARLLLGDITSGQFRAVADLAEAFADGTVRVTPEQNLVFRWVRESDVEAVYRRLAAAGLALGDAGTVADVTSCPGAESCKLAVTQSRGLAQLLGEHLAKRPDLVAASPELKIKVSGCPNGCGLHHIAGIGFQGSIRKLGARAVPQYFVMLGGGVDEGQVTFGRIAAKVPARRAAVALERLLETYLRDRSPGESGLSFFRRFELPKAKALLADLESLTEAQATPEDFVDLGETGEFKHTAMEGECAA